MGQGELHRKSSASPFDVQFAIALRSRSVDGYWNELWLTRVTGNAPSRASLRQECAILALIPWAIATLVTDAPGRSQAAITSVVPTRPRFARNHRVHDPVPDAYRNLA